MLAQVAEEHGVLLYSEDALRDAWPNGAAPRWMTGDDDLDGLITLGGDGTLLRGAGMLIRDTIPILGINMGRVGFLTTASRADLETAVRAFLAGDYKLDHRSTLSAELLPSHEPPQITALNDVVVHHAGVARVLQVRIWVDDQEVGQYSADGIIVASPTGSTAYSLSAGGPIVTPDVDVLIVTAISPHTLAVRPLVVGAQATIRIEPRLTRSSQVQITTDGQETATLEPGDAVVVRRGTRSIPLVRFGSTGFFERVRQKLHWGDLLERLTNE
jgi:NAD+ kinase